MHPEGLRPGVALCDLCFILSHNTKPKELKKKKLLLWGIYCNVHVNTELLSCLVHLVLFNMSFSSVWLFDSLKLLLLLPVLTMQDGNDLLVNGFAFQARLTPEHNNHLSQQEIFAPKCTARRKHWLHWKHSAEPELWEQLQDWGNLTLSAHSPASTPSSADHHGREEGCLWMGGFPQEQRDIYGFSGPNVGRSWLQAPSEHPRIS